MAQSEDEDDYLSMTFAEPAKTEKESSLARTLRLKREAAERGRPLSKAERAKQDEEKRTAGLNTKLDDSNRGAKLMAKMGFAGGALGAANNQGRENPIELSLKLDRGGIGVDNEKKRKIREQAEAQEVDIKRAKVTEAEYRERARQEREDGRAEGQWRGAMKVLEGLEEQKADDDDDDDDGDDTAYKHVDYDKSLKRVNLLYRPLVRDRREAEQRRRDMKSLYEDRKSLHDVVDPDMDADDRLAVDDGAHDDLHTEDEELDEYEGQSATQRLNKVVGYLRDSFHYCFWCKYRYEDETMEGCPGLTEDEHG